MSEKTKVYIAEDNENWLRSLKWMLEDKGYQVVLTAKTRNEALEAVRRIPELGIQVATIDGNLNDLDTSGDYGQAVLKVIKAIAPEVKLLEWLEES